MLAVLVLGLLCTAGSHSKIIEPVESVESAESVDSGEAYESVELVRDLDSMESQELEENEVAERNSIIHNKQIQAAIASLSHKDQKAIKEFREEVARLRKAEKGQDRV